MPPTFMRLFTFPCRLCVVLPWPIFRSKVIVLLTCRPSLKYQVVAALLVSLQVERDENKARFFECGDDFAAAGHHQVEAGRVDLDPGQVAALIPDPDLSGQAEVPERGLRLLDP